mmetsp:Transcript_11605/g.24505  ORF Transcript_11605/g.24505 Transcript_11605/m.24505 type:complete len:347 (-) Transcript_11605:816-1856(-)
MGKGRGVPSKATQEACQKLTIVWAVLLRAETLLQRLAELLRLLRNGAGGPQQTHITAASLQHVYIACQDTMGGNTILQSDVPRPGECPEVFECVDILLKAHAAVARQRREAGSRSPTSSMLVAVLLIADALPRKKGHVALESVDDRYVPVALLTDVVQVEIDRMLHALGILTPGECWQRGADVATDAGDLCQGPRAELLERPGALLDHLRIAAVSAHGLEHGRNAEAHTATLQSFLLLAETEYRPDTDPLHLRAGPVVCHRVHDDRHTPGLMCQKVGAHVGDERDPTGQDVNPVAVPAHGDVHQFEGPHRHPVVIEELSERVQGDERLQLDLRICLVLGHVLKYAL